MLDFIIKGLTRPLYFFIVSESAAVLVHQKSLIYITSCRLDTPACYLHVKVVSFEAFFSFVDILRCARNIYHVLWTMYVIVITAKNFVFIMEEMLISESVEVVACDIGNQVYFLFALTRYNVNTHCCIHLILNTLYGT